VHGVYGMRMVVEIRDRGRTNSRRGGGVSVSGWARAANEIWCRQRRWAYSDEGDVKG
jgi:hypothetical protein